MEKKKTAIGKINAQCLGVSVHLWWSLQKCPNVSPSQNDQNLAFVVKTKPRKQKYRGHRKKKMEEQHRKPLDEKYKN